jgi:hypothetical protein
MGRRWLLSVATLTSAAAALAGWFAFRYWYCGWVNFKSTVAAMRTISRATWRDLDERAVSSAWPGAGARACEFDGTGLQALSAATTRCCATCGTYGAPVFARDEERAPATLRAISVMLCRRSSQQALRDLRRLVDATVPSQRDATYEQYAWSPPATAESVRNGYRWHSGGEAFLLQAFAYGSGRRWVATFDLVKCREVKPSEVWRLDDGSTVSVLRAEVVQDGADDRRELWVSYLTDCPLLVSACLRTETQRFWPRLRERAEKENASVVFLSSEDCSFGSTTVSPDRNADGTWEVPWSGDCPVEGNPDAP